MVLSLRDESKKLDPTMAAWDKFIERFSEAMNKFADQFVESMKQPRAKYDPEHHQNQAIQQEDTPIILVSTPILDSGSPIDDTKVAKPIHDKVQQKGNLFVHKAEDHEVLLATREDPSSPIHPVCIQLIDDKVSSLPHNDFPSLSLSLNTAIGTFCENKKEFVVANKVFDKSPERNGYTVELEPKPPDEYKPLGDRTMHRFKSSSVPKTKEVIVDVTEGNVYRSLGIIEDSDWKKLSKHIDFLNHLRNFEKEIALNTRIAKYMTAPSFNDMLIKLELINRMSTCLFKTEKQACDDKHQAKFLKELVNFQLHKKYDEKRLMMRRYAIQGSSVVFHVDEDVFDGSQCIHDGDETLPYAWKFDNMWGDLKAQAEALVLFANDIDGLLTCALRPSSVFVPGDKQFVPSLIDIATSGWANFIIGSGEIMSDLTYVENVAHALVCAEKALSSRMISISGKVFFITNVEPMKFWDFVTIILEGLGYQRPMIKLPARMIKYIVLHLKWIHSKMNSRKLDHAVGIQNIFQLASCTGTFNCAASQKHIGYIPIVSVEERVKLTLDSFPHLSEALSFMMYKDFDEPSKVEKLLGGKTVSDIWPWRDENKSLTYFLALTLLYYWFFLCERTFVSTAAKLKQQHVTKTHGTVTKLKRMEEQGCPFLASEGDISQHWSYCHNTFGFIAISTLTGRVNLLAQELRSMLIVVAAVIFFVSIMGQVLYLFEHQQVILIIIISGWLPITAYAHAFREVLGNHVDQERSIVLPEKLRCVWFENFLNCLLWLHEKDFVNPELSPTNIQCLQPNTLVRYRGMIQDILGNEFYICVNKDGKTWRTNKFTMSQIPMVYSSDTQNWERRVMYCVPVPGQNSWTESPIEYVMNPCTQFTFLQREKRPRENGAGSDDTNMQDHDFLGSTSAKKMQESVKIYDSPE